mgnify:FL=1
MVVSEENNPKSTTTDNTEKDEIISSLKLDYDLSSDSSTVLIDEKEDIIEKSEDIAKSEESIDNLDSIEEKEKRESILSETDIIDNVEEIVEEENEERASKEVVVPFERGIETGLEILYTSMKLNSFPIKENNLPMHEEIIENISLNNCNLNIGKTLLSNVNVRILGYKKFKLIEFKTREFKLALSVGLFDGNTIRKTEDYFSYEIFSKLKNIRVQAVAKILKNIFSGELISFQIKDLYGDIRFENPIQARKFEIIIESIKKYEECMNLVNTSKVRNFSESSLQFYTLHLLYSYLNKNTTIDSWLNFRITNKYEINSGDKLSFIKIHELNIRGFNYNLKEYVTIKGALSEKEVNIEKNIVSGYRKMVEIRLELIEK